MKLKNVTVLLCLLAGVVLPGEKDAWSGPRPPWDTLLHLPPNMRYYAREVGPSPAGASADSVGIRMVGKWGGGPSNKVTGRGTLLYLSRGSQVVALDFSDPANPHVLSTIEADGVVERSVLVGNVLYVGAAGIEAYDVSDSTSPTRLGQTPRFTLGDMDVVGTYAYTCAGDSFRVFDFSDPEHPQQVGACADSGYALSVCNGYAYVGYRWGLYIIDVRDPANPHRAGSWGTDILSVRARNTICCIVSGQTFRVLDISNPAVPVPIGTVSDCRALDMYLTGPLAFMSGASGHVFRILDISDSTSPRIIGATGTPAEQHWGVWANLVEGRAFVADGVSGLTNIDISNLNAPVVDSTRILAAGYAVDISVDGDFAYVAGGSFGMTILDITDPARPVELGHVDSTRGMGAKTVAARDSFAYLCWQTHPWLKSIDVSDPSNPVKAGTCDLFNPPEEMVLCGSFLYIAEHYKFQVVNVSRPREPGLVGTLALDYRSYGICVRETLAYVSTYPLAIINISNPAQPSLVGSIARGSWSVFVVDTLAYVAAGEVFVYSIANPTTPVLIDSFGVSFYVSDIAIADTFAYLGCDDAVRLMSVADPLSPRVLAAAGSPNTVWKLAHVDSLVAAVCLDAGVCFFGTTQTGVLERPLGCADRTGPTMRPNPTQATAVLRMNTSMRDVAVFDVSGRRVVCVGLRVLPDGARELDFSRAPRGAYWVEVLSRSGREAIKVVRR